LERDGYDVVGEATTPAELARVVADQRPDVVVLDDGIGATAPQVIREIAPQAKVVLVWPGAVVPIGGDVRVEPSQVLRELGAAVAKVTVGVAGLAMIDRPEWIEKVRKDPATLREMLERRGGLPTKRPSVTELQRRGQRLHPEPVPTTDDRGAVAPVVPIPIAVPTGDAVTEPPGGGDDDDVMTPLVAAAAAGATVGAAGGAATEWNRRLGAIALGGAAVVGAVVLALALGGSRVPTDIIMAEGPRATIAPGPAIDSGIEVPRGEPGHEPGQDEGKPPAPVDQPSTEDLPSPGTPTTPPNDPGTGGDGNDEPPLSPDPGGTAPPPTIPDGGDTPIAPVAPDRTVVARDGGGTATVSAPGKSADHNPHQGPPGRTGDPHEASSSATGPAGNGARHGRDGVPGHAGEHGRGIEHGEGLATLVSHSQTQGHAILPA
jgi:hypothetical protein